MSIRVINTNSCLDWKIRTLQENPNLKRFSEGAAQYYDLCNECLGIRYEDGRCGVFDFDENRYYRFPDYEDYSDEAIKFIFAFNFRHKLKASFVSQVALAKETGVPQQMISRYMNGQAVPSFCVLDKIARALKCSMDDFRRF